MDMFAQAMKASKETPYRAVEYSYYNTETRGVVRSPSDKLGSSTLLPLTDEVAAEVIGWQLTGKEIGLDHLNNPKKIELPDKPKETWCLKFVPSPLVRQPGIGETRFWIERHLTQEEMIAYVTSTYEQAIHDASVTVKELNYFLRDFDRVTLMENVLYAQTSPELFNEKGLDKDAYIEMSSLMNEKRRVLDEKRRAYISSIEQGIPIDLIYWEV